MPNGSPDLDLTTHPTTELQSPASTVGALMQMRDAQSQIALRNQQAATALANQQDIQAQTDQRNRDNADQNTIQERMKDPGFAHSVASWDGTSAFPLDGLVSPKASFEAQKAVTAQQKERATLTPLQRTENDAMHAQIGQTVNGLANDENGKPRADADVAALAPAAFGQLVADKQLKPENVPTIRTRDDLMKFAATNRYVQGLGEAASALQVAAGKAPLQTSETGKNDAAAANDRASANKTNALEPGEVAAQATKNAQDAAVLAGTSKTGLTADQQRELAVKEGEERIKRDTFNATLGAGLDANGQPLSPEALKASALLDPTAKAIADYQLAPPPATTRSGMPTPLYRKVLAINPDYDGTQFAARNKVQQGFSASGPQGQAITSADTSLSHLNSISLAGKALKSGDLQQLNRLANFVGAQTGSAAPAVYDSIVATVAPEISKAVIGAAGGEGDRAQMAANFSRNASDAQREGSIAANVGLLAARVQKQAEAYAASMGHPLARQLSPESQAVIQRYKSGGGSGVAPILLKDGTQLTPGSQAQADAFRKDHPDLIK